MHFSLYVGNSSTFEEALSEVVSDSWDFFTVWDSQSHIVWTAEAKDRANF